MQIMMTRHLVLSVRATVIAVACCQTAKAALEEPYRVPAELLGETWEIFTELHEQKPGMGEPVPGSLRRRSATAYILGREAAAIEQYRAAEQFWREAVQLDPSNRAAWEELGDLLVETRRHRSGVKAWSNALADPSAINHELLLKCGLMELMLEKHVDAAGHLMRCRMLQSDPMPASRDVLIQDVALIHVLRELGNVELADSLEQERSSLLEELSSTGLADLESGRHWMSLVEELFAIGDLETARDASKMLLMRQTPEGEHAAYMAANFKMRFVLLAALTGSSGEDVIELVNSLQERDLLRGMPPDWHKPIGLAEALYEAGSDFATLNNKEGAIRLFSEALVHDPTHVLARNNLGYSALEEGPITPRDVQMIESVELDARRSGESLAEVLDTVGWLRYMQNRLEDDERGPGAISLLSESISLQETGDPIVLDHFGDAAWEAGRREEAVRAWSTAHGRLTHPAFRGQKLRNFNLLQGGLWQFRVVDSESMYDREYGVLVEKLAAKIAAEREGQSPPVTIRRAFTD